VYVRVCTCIYIYITRASGKKQVICRSCPVFTHVSRL